MAEFRNPNLQSPGGDGGGSGGDMRGMIAIMLLVVLVVFGFDYFKPKQQPTTAPAAQTQSLAQQQTAQQAAGQTAIPGEPAQPQLAAASVQAPAVTPSIAATEVMVTTVENGNYRIVLTNQGAQAKHWVLLGKQYKDHPDPGGQQLDLINPKAAAFGLPLSLFTYEPELTKQLNSALYQVSVSGAAAPNGVLKAPCSVSFHYAGNGIDVVKTFRFDSSYVVTAEVEVRRNGVPVRALLTWPGGLGDQNDAIQFASGKFAWSLSGKDDAFDAKKISGNATFDLPYEYAAIIDLYFAAAFLPDSPASTTVVTLHNAIELPSEASDPSSQKRPADVIGLAVGDTSGVTRLRLFAGPKETDLLKTIHATGVTGKQDGPSLEPLIQFGWLTPIAKPLYLALRFLRGWLGPGAYNWGWAIIIVTVIFNLVMLPTRFMMLKSSWKMMRIQPKVEAIKNRYKNLKATDPKRAEMQTEMMALYKAEGVNMYGSCLPMLIQMPLFFAYYRVLINAVELRQAHWFWLTDLSAPDPLYILFILIIVLMPITQLITPSPGMERSQRIMMAFMMPVMMGFILLRLPSGLALYWATGNIINLTIQIGINQTSMGKDMHAIAARKAARKAGAPSGPIQKRR